MYCCRAGIVVYLIQELTVSVSTALSSVHKRISIGVLFSTFLECDTYRLPYQRYFTRPVEVAFFQSEVIIQAIDRSLKNENVQVENLQS